MLRQFSGGGLVGVKIINVGIRNLFGVILRQDFLVNQAPGVDIIDLRVLPYLFIHQWLCRRRLIRLTVTVPAVADHVYDYIFFKREPVFQRQVGDKNYCFRVITVYMEDRCLDHLGDIGAIQS